MNNTARAVTDDAPFYQGDLLQHRHWDDGGHQWVNRQVVFKSYVDGEIGVALIEFGQRSRFNGEIGPETYKVPIAELSRPRPRPPIFGPVPAPRPADAAPSIAAPETDKLRDALRTAIGARDAAQREVDNAAGLVSRAESNLGAAQRQLASTVEAERYRVEALEASIRNGSAAAAQGDDGLAASTAKRAVEAAELVLSKFRGELIVARQTFTERQARVATAALSVVAALVAKEAAALADLEERAARKRAELIAADQLLTSDFKVRISDSVARLLSAPPRAIEDPIGVEHRASLFTSRTRRFRELIQRLSGGEVDAELE